MADKLAQTLEECLELLRQGVSLEECLAKYPEDAGELEPLLRTAQVARERLSFGIPTTARARIRAWVMAEWDQAHAPREQHWRLPTLVPRWAVVTVCMVLALLLGGGGTAMAAGGTVPGDLLYPVKMVTEKAQLAFTFSDLAEAELHVDLAERRVDEIRKLVERGEPEKLTELAARVAAHLEMAGRVGAIGDKGIAELKAYLEQSATIQLANLEQILAVAPEKIKPAVEDALVISGEGYGIATEAVASRTPVPVLLAQVGTIQIFVTDPPPPDVNHVWVEVDHIEVHRAAGPDSRWITIVDKPVRFDLVAIVGVQEFIGSKEIEAGLYTQLRMNVTRATVVVGEEEHDAFVPSGRLKFIRPFQVKDGEITGLVLDFDGDRSINVTGAGWYMLKPVVMLFVPGQAGLPKEVREEKIEEVEIEGTIDDFVAGQWLMVAGQKVLIDGDTRIEGTLSIGSICEVEAIPQKDGTLLAIKIKMEGTGRPEGVGLPKDLGPPKEIREEEIEEVEIEGTIEDFVKGQWLMVAGQKVLIDGDTRIEGTLSIGLSCEVKAITQKDGSLLAINIKMEEAGTPEKPGPPEGEGTREKPGPPEDIGPPEKPGPPEEAAQGSLPRR